MKFKLLLFFFFFHFKCCYIIIPLKYLPNFKNINNSHSEIYNSIINKKLYAEIEIGIPKQTIEIPLDFNSNDFYISDFHFNNFDSNSKYFSDIKFYNSSKSISLISLEDIYLDGNNFYLGEYSKDIFYFNETKTYLEFYLPIKLKKIESGGIGLLLNTLAFNSERTFLKILKNKNLVENYYWSILYFDDNIFLLIGIFPHTFYDKLHNYTNSKFDDSNDIMKAINTDVQNGIIKNIINTNKIIIYQNGKEYNFENIKKVELNYHSGGVEAPIILLPIYEKVFDEYIFKKKCFKEEIFAQKNIYYFYCVNENSIINGIKQNFPSIEFYNSDMNYNFILEFNDVFCKKGNYIYFLIFFDNSINNNNNKLIMGKPFTQKYQFTFDPDKKMIFFFNNKIINKNITKLNDLNNNNNKSNFIIIKIIVISIFIFMCIIFFLFLKFFLTRNINRTKKAYELEDEYEYISKNDNTYIINDNQINP